MRVFVNESVFMYLGIREYVLVCATELIFVWGSMRVCVTHVSAQSPVCRQEETYMHTHTYIHTLTITHIHTCTYHHTHTYIHLPSHTYIHLPSHTYIHTLTITHTRHHTHSHTTSPHPTGMSPATASAHPGGCRLWVASFTSTDTTMD